MGFDRKAVPTAASASEAGYTFEPRFPDGTPIGATITVCGPDSRAARALARENLQRLQNLEARAKRDGGQADGLSLALTADPEEGLRNRARSAAAYTMAWSDITEGGQPIECTPAAAEALYFDHPWLGEQVIAKAQDLGNFVKSSSKPSSSTPAPSSGST